MVWEARPQFWLKGCNGQLCYNLKFIAYFCWHSFPSKNNQSISIWFHSLCFFLQSFIDHSTFIALFNGRQRGNYTFGNLKTRCTNASFIHLFRHKICRRNLCCHHWHHWLPHNRILLISENISYFCCIIDQFLRKIDLSAYKINGDFFFLFFCFLFGRDLLYL